VIDDDDDDEEDDDGDKGNDEGDYGDEDDYGDDVENDDALTMLAAWSCMRHFLDRALETLTRTWVHEAYSPKNTHNATCVFPGFFTYLFDFRVFLVIFSLCGVISSFFGDRALERRRRRRQRQR
jgi:hypothetical protein